MVSGSLDDAMIDENLHSLEAAGLHRRFKDGSLLDTEAKRGGQDASLSREPISSEVSPVLLGVAAPRRDLRAATVNVYDSIEICTAFTHAFLGDLLGRLR